MLITELAQYGIHKADLTTLQSRFGAELTPTAGIAGVMDWALHLLPWGQRRNLLLALVGQAFSDLGFSAGAEDVSGDAMRLLSSTEPPVYSDAYATTVRVLTATQYCLVVDGVGHIPVEKLDVQDTRLQPTTCLWLSVLFATRAVAYAACAGLAPVNSAARHLDACSARCAMAALVWAGAVHAYDARQGVYLARLRLVLSALAAQVETWQPQGLA